MTSHATSRRHAWSSATLTSPRRSSTARRGPVRGASASGCAPEPYRRAVEDTPDPRIHLDDAPCGIGEVEIHSPLRLADAHENGVNRARESARLGERQRLLQSRRRGRLAGSPYRMWCPASPGSAVNGRRASPRVSRWSETHRRDRRAPGKARRAEEVGKRFALRRDRVGVGRLSCVLGRREKCFRRRAGISAHGRAPRPTSRTA